MFLLLKRIFLIYRNVSFRYGRNKKKCILLFKTCKGTCHMLILYAYIPQNLPKHFICIFLWVTCLSRYIFPPIKAANNFKKSIGTCQVTFSPAVTIFTPVKVISNLMEHISQVHFFWCLCFVFETMLFLRKFYFRFYPFLFREFHFQQF